jgi:hypothetical protein
MYEFSSWCFLCAQEQNVEVEIKSLSTEIQEKISEFSIVVGIKHINFVIF